MPSSRYQYLNSNLDELRRLLLPGKFHPTGTYHDGDRVRARGLSFRILAHAELEVYFEDRAIEIAKTALQAWKSNRKVSAVTLHLIGFSGRNMNLPPKSIIAPSENRKKTWNEAIALDDRLERCISEYIRKVGRDNHGIKEKHITSILIPLGFPHSKLDQLLITSLNTLGDERGLVAHSSSNIYVTQAVDPQSEWHKIENILQWILPVDDILDHLLQVSS